MKSCFLLCKHLVQKVHPISPMFFLKAERTDRLKSGDTHSYVALMLPSQALFKPQKKGLGWVTDSKMAVLMQKIWIMVIWWMLGIA